MTRFIAFSIFFTITFAQPYRCDWQVIGAGGGMMSGSYRCGSTLGQTTIGIIENSNLMAFIGFWQAEIISGIQEKEHFKSQIIPVSETRLYPPSPNPFVRTSAISYTLKNETRTLIQIYDIQGRVIRTLVNSKQKPGRYSLNWDAKDNTGRSVASGVYICRFTAGDYRLNTKLVLQR
uniref:T9SS type A sorting domain-containing protein n=1 Tax=candidate division WOR-3 bacterium TaxID=2052148 RepID=A0A7C6ECK9_UNCW3